MSIVVITATEALNTIKTEPSKILTLKKKIMPQGKSYKGNAFYLSTTWTAGGKTSSGWFNAKDITITRGIADPAKRDPSSKYTIEEQEKMRLQLQSTVSRSGDFGQFLSLFNVEWKAMVGRERTKTGLIGISNRQVHEIVQTVYGSSHPTNAGGEIEDPVVRIKIDFSLFPSSMKPDFLADQPRTQFFDFTKPFTDPTDGKTHYRPATVIDPKTGKEAPVDASNLHLFVTTGSIIRHIRCMISSVAVTSTWVAMQIIANRVIIEKGAPDGFSDEDFEDGPSNGTPVINDTPQSISLPQQPLISLQHHADNTEEDKPITMTDEQSEKLINNIM